MNVTTEGNAVTAIVWFKTLFFEEIFMRCFRLLALVAWLLAPVIGHAQDVPMRMNLVGGWVSGDRYEIPMTDARASEEIRGLYRILKTMKDERRYFGGNTGEFGLTQREVVRVWSLTDVRRNPVVDDWASRIEISHEIGFRSYDSFSMGLDGARSTIVDGFRSTLLSLTNSHYISWDARLKKLTITTPQFGNDPILEGAMSLRAKSVERNLGSRQTVGGSIASEDKKLDANVSFSSETNTSTKRFMVDLLGLSYKFDTSKIMVYRASAGPISELRICFQGKFASDGRINVDQQLATVDATVCSATKVFKGSGSFADKLLSVEANMSQEARCMTDSNFVTSSASFNCTPGSRGGAYNDIALVSRTNATKGWSLCELKFGSTFNFQFSAHAGNAAISTAERRQGETVPRALISTTW